MIVIPFWWDKKIESVVHTIRMTRPDIMLPPTLLSKGDPIPLDMPKQREFVGTHKFATVSYIDQCATSPKKHR